ncbi:MAG: MMPL family transporter, partial [Chloroflexota bacterium]|nr:MMPL family transporter [Chloroflexota bacterium]
MFYAFGRLVYRFRWFVLAAWGVALAVSLAFAPRVTEPLRVGGFADPALESSKAAAALANDLGYSTSNVIVTFSSSDPAFIATDPRFIAETNTSLAGLSKLRVQTQILSHAMNPRQISRDGRTAFEVVSLATDTEAAAKLMPQITAAITPPPDLTMRIGGGPAFYADVETVSQRDLARAEAVAFPIAVIALLIVFGSVFAAGLPVLVGGVGVVVILAVIYALGTLMELSIFTVNLATLLGLGLGLDYSLFLASRFREELAHGHDVPDAVARTLATAGQAVTYSGLTVLIGLCALLTFHINLLVSIGIGGVVVVIVSVLAATTLLPVLLSIVGTRIDALSVRKLMARFRGGKPATGGEGLWARVAHLVMRHPVAVFLPTLGLLLLLGVPFLHITFSSPDASIVPPSVQSRQVYDILKTEFDANETNPVLVVVKTAPGATAFDPANVASLYDFVRNVQADPRVARVESIVSVDPRLTLPQYQVYYANIADLQDPYITQFAKQYARNDTTLISIISKYPSNGPETRALVAKLRNSAIGNGMTFQVTGATAGVIDVVNGLYRTFPIALLFIVLTTYVVLLLLFRSVVLPLKAIVMNALSIIASYGMLVFVFQDGHFGGLLNFTALHFIEPTLPIIMFCTLFGLSMDYEVFLLSRIKEAYDATGDNAHSVATGIERSARIITSAALIVVLVASSFVTADIVLVKALGLGVAVAVAVDATVVRALLVPATMRLLGHWNWY